MDKFTTIKGWPSPPTLKDEKIFVSPLTFFFPKGWITNADLSPPTATDVYINKQPQITAQRVLQNPSDTYSPTMFYTNAGVV